VEAKTGILRRFAACFTDHRDPERIEHTVPDLMAQRIFALALGYEDLNDHDALRHDPLLAVLVGKADPTGQDRRRREDRGKSLAGKSTLNRLELTPVGADEKSRYKKVVARHRDIENFFVEMFLSLHPKSPKEIVLDFDATDDPIRFTAISWVDSFTAITTATATCRSRGVGADHGSSGVDFAVGKLSLSARVRPSVRKLDAVVARQSAFLAAANLGIGLSGPLMDAF
jgi:hypothetical protein